VARTSASPTVSSVPPPSTAPPPAAAPAPAPIQSTSTDPAAVVYAYFAAINAHDYEQAWSLGGDNLGESYAQFAAGYADTVSTTVTVLSTSGNAVNVAFSATQTDGSQQEFTGTYTVSGQAITGASVTQVGGAAPIAGALCGAPPNPYGYNLCGNGSEVTTPQNDICSYFKCIDNFWNEYAKGNGGYMVECNDGTYSMAGGLDGACSYHGGEDRPVYSGG
jgi:hypothetical protein